MDLLLWILVIVAGYFGLFIWIMSRTGRRWSITTLLVAALAVYCPVICFVVALRQYLEEIGLVLYGAAAVYCCLFWLWEIYRLIRERRQIRMRVLLLLAAYLLAVLYITVFMREGGADGRIQMEVFHWLAEGSRRAFRHAMLNTALFFPVGFLGVFVFVTGRRAAAMSASFGLLCSVLIETAQLLFQYGQCDIDDILTNFAGAAIGAGLAVLLRRKQKDRVL